MLKVTKILEEFVRPIMNTWMMQDQSELYRPLINHKNTHEPSNHSATWLMLHETSNIDVNAILYAK